MQAMIIVVDDTPMEIMGTPGLQVRSAVVECDGGLLLMKPSQQFLPLRSKRAPCEEPADRLLLQDRHADLERCR